MPKVAVEVEGRNEGVDLSVLSGQQGSYIYYIDCVSRVQYRGLEEPVSDADDG
jgi:hypothetical protein